MELDKIAEGYQEEGVIKLLKDIRDGLAGGNRPGGNRPGGNGDDRPDDRSDDRSDGETQIVIKALLDKIEKQNDDTKKLKKDDDRSDGSEGSDDDIPFNNLNNNLNNKINNVQNATDNYMNLIRYQNEAINEF